MEQRIIQVLQRTFNLSEVDDTCSQKTCEQWDSMGQINLALELEMEFDISLEPEEIGTMVSYSDIVNVIKQKQWK